MKSQLCLLRANVLGIIHQLHLGQADPVGLICWYLSHVTWSCILQISWHVLTTAPGLTFPGMYLAPLSGTF